MDEEKKLITTADAEHIARLAHLSFNQEELADCVDKLGQILDYMQELNKIDVSGVPPTTHVLPLTNVFREDQVRPGLLREQALANAPQREGGSFKVPQII